MATILCYGDSNTWGSNADGSPRYGLHQRWPGVLRDQLGDDAWVIEEGLGGRTTIHDDRFEDHKNGLSYLHPCLDSHDPDLVILLLGTNDLKHRFGLSAWDIAAGAGKLATTIKIRSLLPGKKPVEVLLVCPPPILEVAQFVEMFAGGAEKSQQLAAHYRVFADTTGSRFFDAGTVVRSSKTDGIHWEVGEHEKLGRALAKEARKILNL